MFFVCLFFAGIFPRSDVFIISAFENSGAVCLDFIYLFKLYEAAGTFSTGQVSVSLRRIEKRRFFKQGAPRSKTTHFEVSKENVRS